MSSNVSSMNTMGMNNNMNNNMSGMNNMGMNNNTNNNMSGTTGMGTPGMSAQSPSFDVNYAAAL